MPRLHALGKRLRREASGSEPSGEVPDRGGSRHNGNRPGRPDGEVSPDATATADHLAAARQALGEIAAVSGRASASIAQRRAPGQPPAVSDLLTALADRVKAIQEEAGRLATVLDRTEGRLPVRDVLTTDPDATEAEDGAEGSAEMEQIRDLIALLTGAGASPNEVAAWVFREHGVVLSDRVIDDIGQARQRRA